MDLSETFRPFRCLGFVFMQYLQGNSKRAVKQGAESKVTLPISECFDGLCLTFSVRHETIWKSSTDCNRGNWLLL